MNETTNIDIDTSNNYFITGLKDNPTSYYFWSKYNKYGRTTHVYLGTVVINNNSDYQLLIEQILNDLIFKCQENLCFIKLFHDLDNDDKDLLHFLLIIDFSQKEMITKTLLYAISRITNVDNNLSNCKDRINHYLDHIDLYQYKRIKSYQA